MVRFQNGPGPSGPSADDSAVMAPRGHCQKPIKKLYFPFYRDGSTKIGFEINVFFDETFQPKCNRKNETGNLPKMAPRMAQPKSDSR